MSAVQWGVVWGRWIGGIDDVCVPALKRSCRAPLIEINGLPMCPQVAKVNQVEAAYWKMSSGYRLDESTHILGFDCGGQQWVLEVRPHRKRRRRRPWSTGQIG